MTSNQGKPCTFGIRIGSKEDPNSGLPDELERLGGFHVEGASGDEYYCPRGDVPADEVDPSGEGDCPHYDKDKCLRAYSEEAYCPKRKKDALERARERLKASW